MAGGSLPSPLTSRGNRTGRRRPGKQFQQSVRIERDAASKVVEGLPETAERSSRVVVRLDEVAPTQRGIAEVRCVHERDFVSGTPEVLENVLKRPQVADVHELRTDLLAELTRDGVVAALAKLDRSAERAIADDVLHGVRHL